MKHKIIYALTTEDIQTVSNEEIGRDLSIQEIEMIKDSIANRIDWFDAIAQSINEKIS